MIGALILLAIALGLKMLIDWLATITPFFGSWTIVFTVIAAVAGAYAAIRVILATISAIRSMKRK